MTNDSRLLPPNFSAMYHLQSVDGYDPLFLRRYAELIAASERGKPDIHPPFGFNRIITPHNVDSRVMDLLGVKYVLSFSDLLSPKFVKVFEEGQTKVYKNVQAFPRAFFVTEIKSVLDKDTAMKTLFDATNDLYTTAVVEGWNKQQTRFASGPIKILEYTANKVILTTQNQKEGFLVLTDTFYPTWHAVIDGEETKIYLTDYNFRGIIVPPGNHSIIFSVSLF